MQSHTLLILSASLLQARGATHHFELRYRSAECPFLAVHESICNRRWKCEVQIKAKSKCPLDVIFGREERALMKSHTSPLPYSYPGGHDLPKFTLPGLKAAVCNPHPSNTEGLSCCPFLPPCPSSRPSPQAHSRPDGFPDSRHNSETLWQRPDLPGPAPVSGQLFIMLYSTTTVTFLKSHREEKDRC